MGMLYIPRTYTPFSPTNHIRDVCILYSFDVIKMIQYECQNKQFELN